MFSNIEKCLSEYKEVCERLKRDNYRKPTKEEESVLNYFDLHFAEAIMTDFQYCDKGEKVAKIILAVQGLSNEIKVKIE